MPGPKPPSPATCRPTPIVDWFDGRTPNSSIGRIRLGEAMVATGESTQGAALIRQGWAKAALIESPSSAILQNDAPYLTPESDRARLDALLWRGEITAARREMAARGCRAPPTSRNARIALAMYGLAQAPAVRGKAARNGSSDPGLLFDWARALRMAHQDDGCPCHAAAHRPAAPWSATMPRAGGRK